MHIPEALGLSTPGEPGSMGAPLGNTTADGLSHSNCGSASPKSVTSAVALPSTYRTETDLARPA
jgi:hypothetical protein